MATAKTARKATKKLPNVSKELSYTVTVPKAGKRKLSFFIGLIVVLGLLYLMRGVFVAAIVNGNPISRLSVVRELEKQSGQQVLQNLVTKALIEDEAKNKKVSVSQQEIDAEMKKIDESLKKSGQSLADVLKARNLDKKDVESQIKTQKLVEKMISDKINVTDQEVKDFVEKNKDSLPQGETPEKANETAKNQLEQQKKDEEFNKLLTELQKKANIIYFVKY